MDVVHCPVCPGNASLLGRLGMLSWWRCRDCGHEFVGPAWNEVDDET